VPAAREELEYGSGPRARSSAQGTVVASPSAQCGARRRVSLLCVQVRRDQSDDQIDSTLCQHGHANYSHCLHDAIAYLLHALHMKCMAFLLSSPFWPMPSMSRRVINCAKQVLSHLFSRIKSFDQWAVDQEPILTSTTSAKIGKTAICRAKATMCRNPALLLREAILCPVRVN